MCVFKRVRHSLGQWMFAVSMSAWQLPLSCQVFMLFPLSPLIPWTAYWIAASSINPPALQLSQIFLNGFRENPVSHSTTPTADSPLTIVTHIRNMWFLLEVFIYSPELTVLLLIISSPNLLPARQLHQTKGWHTLGHPPRNHAVGAHFPLAFSFPQGWLSIVIPFFCLLFCTSTSCSQKPAFIRGWAMLTPPMPPFACGARLPPHGCLQQEVVSP